MVQSFFYGAWAMTVFTFSYQAFYTTFESSIIFQHAGNSRRYGVARSFCSIGYASFTGFLGLSGLLASPDTKRLLVFFVLLLGLALVSVLLFFQHHTDASHGHSSGQSNLAATAQNQQKQPNKKMQWLLLAIGLAWGLLLGKRNIFSPIYVRDVVKSENIGLMFSILSEIPMLFFATSIAVINKYFAAKKAWANLPAPVEHRLAG